jgi:hypothetical protein
VLVYNSHYRTIDGEAAFDWIQDLDFEEIKSEIEIPELIFKSEQIEINQEQDEKQPKICPHCREPI